MLRSPLVLEVVDREALIASNDMHITDAARSDEPDAMRLALDAEVGAERGSVDRQSHVAPLDAALRDQLVEPRQARLGRVGVGRQHLRDVELPRRRLQHEVGERPPDVEADAVGHHCTGGREPGAIGGWPETRCSLAAYRMSLFIPPGPASPARSVGGPRRGAAWLRTACLS